MRKAMKIIAAALWMTLASAFAVFADSQFAIGDYVQIGRYEGDPIIWRYADEDENGKLLVSDDILCQKRMHFRSDDYLFWHNSCLREWLNSTGDLGMDRESPFENNLYGCESGFLSDVNFTTGERSLIKPVELWTMLDRNDIGYARRNGIELITNGVKHFYSIEKTPMKLGNYEVSGAPELIALPTYYGLEDVPEIYYGAAQKLEERVFLLDELQLYRIWQNLGDYSAHKRGESDPVPYYLRTYPSVDYNTLVNPDGSFDNCCSMIEAEGIRPAFYLDESAVQTVTGGGTHEDPYVINAPTEEELTNTRSARIKESVIIRDTESNTPEGAGLQIGSYVLIGSYDGEPILWQYAADDDNGKLFVSKDILCEKKAGIWEQDIARYPEEALWNDSCIRDWLNSESDPGLNRTPKEYGLDDSYESRLFRRRIEGFIRYENIVYQDYKCIPEPGFLSDKNFNDRERALFKTVSQWTMIVEQQPDLISQTATQAETNGERSFFSIEKERSETGSTFDGVQYYDISDVPQIYHGAARKGTEKVFLLDEMQLYRVWQNLGDFTACVRGETEPSSYMLRSNPRMLYYTNIKPDGVFFPLGFMINGGIRPAFYLDESAVQTVTGSGTLEDPYVINAPAEGSPDEITVLLDGEKLSFDVPPMLMNDRTMVPFRKIFEAFGAEVGWEEAAETVTAVKGDTTLSLVIGTPSMTVGGETVVLDTAPVIVNDRTLVPLRAVSEALHARVDWVDETQTVIIDTK